MSNTTFPEISASVVISTRNGSREIVRVLEALLSGTRIPDEVIVLDQSDDDATERLVEEVSRGSNGERIRYVANDREGLCAHRNDAISESRGEFVASVDDDIVVDGYWLERMLGEWVNTWNKQPVLITGQIRPAPILDPLDRITAIRIDEQRKVYSGKPSLMNVLIGGQFGASREVFESLQPAPFDERLGVGSQFPGADDDEFAYRVMKLGFPIIYEPSIFVEHYTLPVKNWRRMKFGRAIGTGASMAKHTLRGDWRAAISLIEYSAVQIAKSVQGLLRFSGLEASSRFVAFVGAFYGYAGWMLASATKRLRPEANQPGSGS